VEAALAEIEGFKHTLHLYSSDVSKYAIQAPFFAAAEGEEVVYVTNDDPEAIRREFGGFGIKLSVIRPEELEGLGGRGIRLVIDAGSIDPAVLRKMRPRAREALKGFIDHTMRERYLAENFKEHLIMCTYDMGKLTPELVKQLAALHDKLMLTRSDATIVAAESLDRAGLSAESVQQFVKDELETIVLALLVREPMCGTDIIKTIHTKFGVLLSPGTIYPLLHDLEKKKLLTCEYGVKTKTYRPVKGAEGKIRGLLEEHVKASMFLSRFLQATGAGEKR
jgi:predicted transcriptional regulator